MQYPAVYGVARAIQVSWLEEAKRRVDRPRRPRLLRLLATRPAETPRARSVICVGCPDPA